VSAPGLDAAGVNLDVNNDGVVNLMDLFAATNRTIRDGIP
jgi:hypothetical protein